MQQTKNYKLNLIETSDTFSPAPLNENAEKTEAALAALHAADTALTGAVSAAAAENCLVKLGGPLMAQTKAQELVFDLSGVDMGQFFALLFLGRSIDFAAELRINDLEPGYAIFTSNPNPIGFALLMDTGRGGLSLNAMFVSPVHAYQSITTFACTIAEITRLTIYGNYNPGTCFALYGIRA